jgi:hypothetical protein
MTLVPSSEFVKDGYTDPCRDPTIKGSPFDSLPGVPLTCTHTFNTIQHHTGALASHQVQKEADRLRVHRLVDMMTYSNFKRRSLLESLVASSLLRV